MRKVMLLAALVALFVMMLASAAFAVNKQCENVRCNGTDKKDTLYERGGNTAKDRIYGLEGNDTIDANTFGKDEDRLYGGKGKDTLSASDGDTLDVLKGGRGSDKCFGDEGDVFSSCEQVNGV